MSSKALKGQFMAAIAMTLVLVIALSSSTYAWFTMNQSVSASGMKVKAAAGTGLVIAVWDNDAKAGSTTEVKGYSTYAASVDASEFNTERAYDEISPSSTVDAKNWYTATAASANAMDAKNAEYSLATEYTNKYQSGIYYYDKYSVKTNDGIAISDKYLQITSLTVSDGTDASHTAKSGNLNKAIRVAIVVDSSTVYFFAPSYNAGSYPDVDGIKKGTGTNYEVVAMSTTPGSDKLFAGTDTIDLSTSSIAGETIVEMYIYYDGEDENCYTNNTLNGLDQLSVSINFAAKDVETTT